MKYSESSLILDIFTYEKGLRSFIVSGVRTTKSSGKASVFQHLNILDIVAYDKEDGLARIKEQKISYFYQKLTIDVVRSSIGLFILEVCKNAIKEREANHDLFDFIYQKLVALDTIENNDLSLFPITFLLELSEYIGFLPNNNHSQSCRYFNLQNGEFVSENTDRYVSSIEISEALSRIISNQETHYNRRMRNKIIDDLVIYYRLHIESFGELKTLDVLRVIF